MTNKFFESLIGMLSLIMIAVTLANQKYFWYFIVGFIISFVLGIYLTKEEYPNYDCRMLIIFIASIIGTFIICSLGIINDYLFPDMFFVAIGCLLFVFIGKAWFQNNPNFQ